MNSASVLFPWLKIIVFISPSTSKKELAKNDSVPPFNLMPNSISYLKDGSIYYKKDEKDNRLIAPLNLNKELLKKIRRIWYLFSKTDVTLDALMKARTENEIKETIAIYLDVNPLKSISDNKIIDSFKTSNSWELLIKYRYFLSYFRDNIHFHYIPCQLMYRYFLSYFRDNIH